VNEMDEGSSLRSSEPSAADQDGQSRQRAAMLARRAELLASHPEIHLARKLGPLMGEHEREYWIWTVETMERELSAANRPHYTEYRKAAGAPAGWKYGYLPCGCRDNGEGRHVR